MCIVPEQYPDTSFTTSRISAREWEMQNSDKRSTSNATRIVVAGRSTRPGFCAIENSPPMNGIW